MRRDDGRQQATANDAELKYQNAVGIFTFNHRNCQLLVSVQLPSPGLVRVFTGFVGYQTCVAKKEVSKPLTV
jgi:hypothetical protein